ncbi:hypothetical protein FNH04_42060 [Streptomyces phyllanthi]|uniref:Serine/arginine repetitive matrix protein 2 n=1 Tax=Streptomyces phyllanthi TaxID=1803180 RepID=A0A5N8WG73_9ACTN|nr:hypothetical protein [Streptomyces phyllanthi]
MLVAAVLVGAGAGFGGWYLWGRDGDGTHRDGARPEASTVSGTTGASPSESESEPGQTVQGTPSPSPSPPPPGYRKVSEKEFDIAVPEDWKRRTEVSDQGVTLYFYEAPDTRPRRYVEIFKVTERGATPRGTLETAEKDLPKWVGNYRRIDLRDVPDDRGEAAELDYSHHNKQWDVDMRTVYRVIHGDETQLYAVLTSGPAEEWTELRQVLETASDSFCLDGGC